MVLWLFLIALFLLLCRTREHYVEIKGPGDRPSKTPAWLSKIDAAAPIGGDDDAYISVLQKFYDDVYKPLRTDNETAELTPQQIEEFLDTPGNLTSGVDKNAMRSIILAGFAFNRTGSGETTAERELKSQNFAPTDRVQSREGVDPLERKEGSYTPVDSRLGNLSEGLYAPVPQQQMPRHTGEYDDNSTSWSKTSAYSVCEGGPCAENVL